MMASAPNRRWLRWSLRTMFVVVTIIAAFCSGWVAGRAHLLGQQADEHSVPIDDPFRDP
jgi:hypothetical protein